MPFAQLLRREGIPAEAKETETLSISKLFALELKDVALICLCYLEHATPAQLHYTSRRLRRKAPGVSILVCIFNEAGQTPMAIRSSSRRAWSSCKALCLPASNASPKFFFDLGLT